jgi:fructose-1,6-bisphosphatase/inositol monophosphatase family enzyme
MSIVDTSHVASIISDIAAEIILPRYKHLSSGDIREKQPGDLVTIADTEAEAALTRRLSDLLKGSRVVGEEAVSADAKVLDHLQGTGPVWILDPVDGTSNFVKGNKAFAVIVALVMDGQTVQGWIHDPVMGRTTVAERGAGAWRDGHRLTIAASGPLSSMSGAVGYRPSPHLTGAVNRLVNQGSAAHEYLSLLDNQLHFASFRRLHPWDHAAGVLLHSEAGGFNALLNGEPYRPVPLKEALLLAPDRKSWDQLSGYFPSR